VKSRLVQRNLLDVRPAAEAESQPWRDAVQIPYQELAERTHELPPASTLIQIADCEDAAVARDWLRAHGRAAEIAERDEPARPPEGARASREPDDEIGRLWQPTEFLERIEPQVRAGLGGRPGRSLDLACGSGRDVVFLASRGWNAEGVDILPDALQRAEALATRCRAALHRAAFRCADLTRIAAGDAGAFQLVTMFRYLDRERLPALLECVSPGGYFAVETFTTAHRERFGKPSRDAHLLKSGELPSLLAGMEIVLIEEVETDRACTARGLARRPG